MLKKCLIWLWSRRRTGAWAALYGLVVRRSKRSSHFGHGVKRQGHHTKGGRHWWSFLSYGSIFRWMKHQTEINGVPAYGGNEYFMWDRIILDRQTTPFPEWGCQNSTISKTCYVLRGPRASTCVLRRKRIYLLHAHRRAPFHAASESSLPIFLLSLPPPEAHFNIRRCVCLRGPERLNCVQRKLWKEFIILIVLRDAYR